MKRVTIVFMLLCMLLSIVSACTPTPPQGDTTTATTTTSSTDATTATSEPPKPVTILFWNYPWSKGITGQEPDADYGQLEQFLIEKFQEEYPHITVDYEQLPYNGGPDKVLVSIASKTNADVIFDTAARLYSYGLMGSLLPLDDEVSDTDKADYGQVWDEMVSGDGKHYMLPQSYSSAMIALNMDMVRKAKAEDLVPGEDGERSWTYDEFTAFLRKMREADMYGAALYAGNEQGDSGTFTLIKGFGWDMFKSDFSGCTFNSPEGIQAMEYMKMLVDEDLVVKGAESIKSGDANAMFKSQQVASFLNARPAFINTVIAEYENAGNKPPEMRLVLAPNAPGKSPASYASYNGVSVFRSSPEKEEAALLFAEFLNSLENNRTLCKAVSYMPARSSAAEGLYEGIPNMEYNVLIGKYAFDPGVAFPGDFEKVRAYFYPELQAMFTNQKDGAAAANDFAKAVQALCK